MSINKYNYEEWMVAFLDNELSANETVVFNQFIAMHPELSDELNAFELAQFTQEETIIYDNKEALHKKSGATILLKKVWPVAAALVLALIIWPFINKTKNVQEKVIAENKTEIKIQKIAEKKNTPKQESAILEEVATRSPNKKVIEQVIKPIVKKIASNSPTPKIKRAILTTNKKIAAKKEAPEKLIEKPIYKSDKPVIVQEKEIEKKPKPITPIKKKSEDLAREFNAPKQTDLPETNLNENNNALVIIDDLHHPQLYNKLNTMVTEVENKIETIKELKKQSITVRIGKRKLFTINN